MNTRAQDPRLEDILDVLLSVARQEFDARAPVSDALDTVDAIATGINIVAEELSGAVASKAELERAYRDRQTMQAQLAHSGKLAAVGELAGGVAHEINNPATAVVMAAALGRKTVSQLRTKLDAGATREELEEQFTRLEELWADADEAMIRIRSVCEDLLTFSRMDDGPQVPISLNEVVRASCRLMKPSLKGSAELELLLGEPPAVMGSRGRIAQVVTNLLVNAAQAVDEDPATQRIRVTTLEDGEQALITVEDTGPGVAADVKERIFEAFFTTKPAGIGTGLGLALVLEIIDHHRGTIEVGRSELGGARFSVRLPGLHHAELTMTAGGRAPVAESEHPPGAEKRPRILIVDDEELLLKTYRHLLGRAYEVVVAKDGEGGVEVLKVDNSFDLILCDVHMPGLDGIGLYGFLEENMPHLVAAVVMTTGVAVSNRARKFLDETRPPILRKPFNLKDLRKLIAQRLDG
ncbi:MAG: response regulator [Deltaproteobacteria bacterium]|nr:response regulator [Deltaproteobacteria bacterium]